MQKMKKAVFFILLIFSYAQVSAQFLESFDTKIPESWKIIDNDGQGNTWHFNAGNAYQGTGEARMNFETEAHDDYLISPNFKVLSGVTDQISFYAGASGQNYPESFDVKVSTTGTNPSDFSVTLGSVNIIADVNSDGYVNYTYDLTQFVGSNVHVAIVATSTAAFHLYIDEFAVEALPACPKPTNFILSSLSAVSATLNWTAGTNGASSWEVKYGKSGFDPNTAGTSLTVQSSTVTLNNLEPNEKYTVYVRKICQAGAASEFTGPVVFVTPCQPAASNFTEGFEGYTVDGSDLGGCWTQERILGGSNWKLNKSIVAQNRGPRTGDWDIYIGYGNDVWMFRPFELVAGKQYTLTFYARQSNTGGAFVKAAYGNSDKAIDMTNEIIPETTVINGDYQMFTGNFTAATSGIIYIGINGRLNSGFFPFYMALDDISLHEQNPCPQPSDLVKNSVDPNSASVSWTPGASEPEWLLKYGEPGFDPSTSGTSVSVSGEPTTTIAGLTPAHTYNVFVQAHCDGQTGVSNFTGPLSITTPPVNDNLCDALKIIVDSECTGGYTNVGATSQTDEPMADCFDSPGVKTVWFKFEAPASGDVTVTTDFPGGTLKDTEVAVYGAPDNCNDLTTLGNILGCDEDSGVVENGYLSVVKVNNLVPGSLYYIQVTGFIEFSVGSTEGSFCIEVQDDSLTCLQPSNLKANQVQTNSAQIDWTPSGGETMWEVLYGNSGLDPISEGTYIADNDGEAGVLISGLSPNTVYDVYVRALCGGSHFSEWEGPTSFSTQTLDNEEKIFSNFKFFPNPVGDELELKASAPIQKIVITALSGQRVAELSPNSKDFKLSTRSFNKGGYLLSVVISGTTRTYKLLKK